MNQLVALGILTINEVRDVYGLAPVAGGDVLTVQTPYGAVAVADLHRFFKK
jgi:hypothetical protein